MLAGDSCHKLAPNQGFGSSGIQDVVALANELHLDLSVSGEFTDGGSHGLDQEAIADIFHRYQQACKQPAEKDYYHLFGAHEDVCLEHLDSLDPGLLLS